MSSVTANDMLRSRQNVLTMLRKQGFDTTMYDGEDRAMVEAMMDADGLDMDLHGRIEATIVEEEGTKPKGRGKASSKVLTTTAMDTETPAETEPPRKQVHVWYCLDPRFNSHAGEILAKIDALKSRGMMRPHCAEWDDALYIVTLEDPRDKITALLNALWAVSYTHLTLPTKRIV